MITVIRIRKRYGEQSGAELYRTDYQGSIVFAVQNGKLAVTTKKG